MFGFKKRLASIGVISGKDAERFLANMEEAKLNKISDVERAEMEANYKSIMSKANFNN